MSDQKNNPALDALRRNVSGRVESGEAEAITEVPAMTTERAEELAREDFEQIRRAVDGNRSYDPHGTHLAAHGRSIVVDGSMLSPSWRALSGGEQVYGANTDPYASKGYSVQDAYTETLDRLTDDWSGPNGEYLFWDEGCLFVGIGEQED